MRKVDGKLIYSPSDLITYMDSPFDSWMDRYYLEFPEAIKPDDKDEGAKLVAKLGDAHETAYLQKLQNAGHDVAIISSAADSSADDQLKTADAFAELATIKAMRDGREIIYQAVLAADKFAGKADFLFKVAGDSNLGPYHYEAWDTKLARQVKPYFVIQLCCYAEMLERVQGRLPECIRIVLGDSTEASLRTSDYFHYYQQFKRSFLDFQDHFCRDSPPDECIPGQYSRWSSHASKSLEERDDLFGVANIRQIQIRRLTKANITTMHALANSDLATVLKLAPDTLNNLRSQARLQIQSKLSGHLQYEMLPPQLGKGLALLPPASSNDLFFDMEGYPHIEGGLEYLFGVVYEDGEEVQFKDWWAHDRVAEQNKFEEFVDWVYARWQADPDMHIYHYAHYEVNALRRLAGSHATRVDQIDNMLRAELFVDLYQVVRQSMRVGEPAYSIKNIEHLFGKSREGTVATAMDSVVFYERWLQTKDDSILNQIRIYNQADCQSTLELASWLRQRQKEESIAYTGKVIDSALPAPPQSDAAILTRQMLDEAKDITDPQEKCLHELLAHLLEFHKREDKPMWWRMFDRQKATIEELIDDLDCLAALTRTEKPAYDIRRSKAYEYQFDPDQDTKLGAGSTCRFVHDGTDVTIESLDRQNGMALLTLGPSKPAPPEQVSLIPCDVVNNDTIARSLYRVALSWKNKQKFPQALLHLLSRCAPQIKGKSSAAPVAQSSELNQIIEAVQGMDRTCLCLQGPPGCGKTYTASHTILALLRAGKKIAITSNSHKAIEHLLEKVGELAVREAVPLRAGKIGGEKPDSLNETTLNSSSKLEDISQRESRPRYWHLNIEHVKDVNSFFKKNDWLSYNLLAGTAWFFSHENAERMVDYLFVDEAGQVALANLVAMAPSTENIVLLGDQMQLEQPIQGAHPGDSGKSCLEYLLAEHATIPPSLGILLNTSMRLHPALCDVLSNAIYEGRLRSLPDNERRVLIPPPKLAARFLKNAGIVWMPVAHEGNAQASDEEVDAIELLVADLLQCQIIDRDFQLRSLELKDILIVAPYNMQVRRLTQRIKNARVASVDKFQGLEESVVILSMCASEASSSPRGLEFLFSKNRLNVALSRALTLAFVVGHPSLASSPCTSLHQMELLNFFCRIVEAGEATQNPNIHIEAKT